MKRKSGRKVIWTPLMLRQGFERFFLENGRYPKAIEIDKCNYFCGSRYIQKKYGGVEKLRELLEITDSSYGTGERRKTIGRDINRLSITSEKAVGDFLKARYGEICVHEEKKYGSGRNRVDFLIFAKPRFAVEVFNTYTMKNLLVNLNMKLRKFRDFPYDLFFVVTGAEFAQNDINRVILQKRSVFLSTNMKCVGFKEFKDQCSKFQPIGNPGIDSDEIVDKKAS